MSKNTISDRAINSASEATRRLNPHLFTPQEPKKRPAIFVQNGLKEKRIRQSDKPLCNELEAAWGRELTHTNPGARPQAVRLKLGNGISYTPDWVDLTVHPVRAWECKGPFAHRGGFENLKVSAAKYQEIKFTLVWKTAGQWKQQEILP